MCPAKLVGRQAMKSLKRLTCEHAGHTNAHQCNHLYPFLPMQQSGGGGSTCATPTISRAVRRSRCSLSM